MSTTTTEPKTRRKAMFFEKVGGDKEIPFGKTLVLNKGDYFTTGKLISKTETENGFEYLFVDDRKEFAGESFDYWLLPVVS